MNNILEHSEKGSSWKKHKYIRKEGNRYIYVENKDKLNPFQKANRFINGSDISENNLKKDINRYNDIQDNIDRVNKNFNNGSIDYKRMRISELRQEQKKIEQGMVLAETFLNAQTYHYESGLGRTPHGNDVRKLKKN